MKKNIALTAVTPALAGLCCAISLITVHTAAPTLLSSHVIAVAVGVVLLAVIVTIGPTRLSLAGLMISLCVVGLCLCCFIEESDYGLHHNLVMFGREALSPAFFLSPALILLYAWARRAPSRLIRLILPHSSIRMGETKPSRHAVLCGSHDYSAVAGGVGAETIRGDNHTFPRRRTVWSCCPNSPSQGHPLLDSRRNHILAAYGSRGSDANIRAQLVRPRLTYCRLHRLFVVYGCQFSLDQDIRTFTDAPSNWLH